MAATLPKLPGAGLVAEAQLGLRWTAPALARVESVALTAEGVTLALAPNALAMAARDSSGGKAGAKAAPPSSGGPGEWVKANEAMPEHSRRYQAQVTGAPEGYVYREQTPLRKHAAGPGRVAAAVAALADRVTA